MATLLPEPIPAGVTAARSRTWRWNCTPVSGGTVALTRATMPISVGAYIGPVL